MDELRDKMLNKVKKLLALAGSSNLNEAAAAAEAAQRLMFQYKITRADITVKPEEADPIVDRDILADLGQRSATSWQVTLLNAISNANFCRLIITRSSAWKAGKLQVFGTQEDVQAVHYLFLAVTNQLHALCDAWAGQYQDALGYSPSKSQRNSFRVGGATTVANRVLTARRTEERKVRAAAPQGSTAIVLLDQTENRIENHVREKFRHTSTYRSSGPSDYCSYRAGQEAGHQVMLSGSRAALKNDTPALSPGQER